jgi:hypothetical protein
VKDLLEAGLTTEAEINSHLNGIQSVDGRITFQQFEDFVGRIQETSLASVDPRLLGALMKQFDSQSAAPDNDNETEDTSGIVIPK